MSVVGICNALECKNVGILALELYFLSDIKLNQNSILFIIKEWLDI